MPHKSTKVSTREGNIREFVLHQAKDGGNSIDASGAVVDIKYYEDVFCLLYTSPSPRDRG